MQYVLAFTHFTCFIRATVLFAPRAGIELLFGMNDAVVVVVVAVTTIRCWH